MSRDTLVREGGDLLPAVLQHAQLQANLQRILGALGLGRRETPKLNDLDEYLAANYPQTRRR